MTRSPIRSSQHTPRASVAGELVVSMGADEARQCIVSIQTHMQQAAAHLGAARRAILELDRRQGWKALGYASLRACLKEMLGSSQAQVYRTLAAARIEETLGLPLGSQPEGRLRGLSALHDAPELQRFAWRIVELVAAVEHEGIITGPLVAEAAALVERHPELAGGAPRSGATSGPNREEREALGVASPVQGESDDLCDEDVIAAVEELLCRETPDIAAALALAERAPLAEVRASLRRKIAATVQSLRARARLREEDATAMAKLAQLLRGLEELGSWPEQRARLRAAHDLLAQIRYVEPAARAHLRAAAATVAARVGPAELVAGFQVSYDPARDTWHAYDAACDLELVADDPAKMMAVVVAADAALAAGWQVRALPARTDLESTIYRLSRADSRGQLETREGGHLPSLLAAAPDSSAVAAPQCREAVSVGPAELHQAYVLAALTARLTTAAAARFEQLRRAIDAGGQSMAPLDPALLDTAVAQVLDGCPIPEAIAMIEARLDSVTERAGSGEGVAQ